MRILQRYIHRTLMSTTALVILVFLVLQIFFGFLQEMRSVGRGEYNTWQALIYVVLDTPEQFYGLFPMVGLIGILLGLHFLSSQNELTVMRTSGVSFRGMIQTVLKFAIVITLGMTLIGEVGGPLLHKKADQKKAVAMSGGQALNTRHGLWLKEGNHFIHIQSVVSEDHLEGVTRFEFDATQHLVEASYAKYAFYQNHVWQLKNIVQSRFTDHHVVSKSMPSTIWAMSLYPHLLKIAALEPEDMTLLQLSQTIHYRTHNGLRVSSYALSFWQRIFAPLSTVLMMLLALPFVFGTARSATLGVRLLMGIGVGFIFYLLREFLGPLSLVLQFPPIIAAILPSILFMGVGYFLIKEVHDVRRNYNGNTIKSK